MTTLYDRFGEPTTYEDDDLDHVCVLDKRGRVIAEFPYEDERSATAARELAAAVVSAIKCTETGSASATEAALKRIAEFDR